MRLTFTYPSGDEPTGGPAYVYEVAKAMGRRGHDVTFLHGPRTPHRVASVDELPSMCFGGGVVHHVVDALDDPVAPDGDVVFAGTLETPPRLGLPALFLQGYRMVGEELERAAFRRPALKLCVATWLQEVGAEMGSDPAQLRHLPPGQDHDLFAVRRPLTDRPIDLAMLHNPWPAKGWVHAAEALRRIVEARPDTRITVFGRGVRPDLPDGVEYRRGLDHPALAELYNQTRVFAQASLFEGFGLTCIESMGCGAALVTTDCGGSREYAVPGETAVVVEAGDGAALADAITALLDDEERRLRLAERGAAFVRRFDWDRTAEILEAELERYVADPVAYQRPPTDP